MDVSHVSRAAGWSRPAVSPAAPEVRPRVAVDDRAYRDGNFFRGVIIGLIIVTPFWAAVAYVVTRLLR
jgi:hypothetical protein